MADIYDSQKNVMKETLAERPTNTLFDICRKDLDTIAFLAKACSYPDKAFKRMEENDIVGRNLYILYHDCCDSDVAKALYVMTNARINEIKDHIKACTKFE
jgi:hypothetical protein